MTLETRQFIEPGDVSAIEVECGDCRVRTFYPLSADKQVPKVCPHCQHDWFQSMRAMDDALRNFKKAVKNYVEDRGKDAGMKLSIEITANGQIES